jgi:hypothetical protein
MALTPLLSPLTSTGVGLSVIVPVAQLADLIPAPALDRAGAGEDAGVFEPRGNSADTAAEAAHVDRWGAVRLRPVTQLAIFVPAPALVTAQVWSSPVAMALTPLPSPLTSIGVGLSVFVPSPSWP